jgi:type 1 fimbriae regulatory protein FimB/type 1 fimbriae regulatory protein FimE
MTARCRGISRYGLILRETHPGDGIMPRCGCPNGHGPGGDALANAGHDTRVLQAWLGHKNIQHTVRYTELAPHRFKDFWR